jgi:DNA-binding GntR family transcriptional regulator
MVVETASIEGIERRTLSSQVYKSLERKVLCGEMAPGTRLSEESLAESYGVSRSPAREALAELERAGLAVKVGMRDRMIAVPTAEMISQKYDAWWVIDVGRTYLASLEATPEDIAELKQYVKAMAQALKAGDNETYRDNVEKFHDRIRRPCGNKYVTEMGRDCDMLLKWFETLYDRNPELSQTVLDEHRNILAAYENRDLPQLSTTIRDHVMRQRQRILAFFKVQDEPAS